MLGDVEKWIEMVKNPAWLSNLRTVAFELDVPAKMKGVEPRAKLLTEDQDRGLDRKFEGCFPRCSTEGHMSSMSRRDHSRGSNTRLVISLSPNTLSLDSRFFYLHPVIDLYHRPTP
jgi:hypothetical protein